MTTTLKNTNLNDYKRIVKNTKKFNSGFCTSKSNKNSTTFVNKTTGKITRTITYTTDGVVITTPSV
jgi:hypothetical protein